MIIFSAYAARLFFSLLFLVPGKAMIKRRLARESLYSLQTEALKANIA